MIDLLLDGAIFGPVHAGTNNYFQISGTMLSDLSIALT